jgi:hypothetical protein
MLLRDSYVEHRDYFLALEREMKRIAKVRGLNGLGTEVIDGFCTAFGDLPLNSTEEYKEILDIFRTFTAGVTWTLQTQ